MEEGHHAPAATPAGPHGQQGRVLLQKPAAPLAPGGPQGRQFRACSQSLTAGVDQTASQGGAMFTCVATGGQRGDGGLCGGAQRRRPPAPDRGGAGREGRPAQRGLQQLEPAGLQRLCARLREGAGLHHRAWGPSFAWCSLSVCSLHHPMTSVPRGAACIHPSLWLLVELHPSSVWGREREESIPRDVIVPCSLSLAACLLGPAHGIPLA